MNKRIKKKKHYKDIKEVIYMKLAINENLDSCPTFKFKSWRKFMKGSRYYANKYKCDFWVSLPEFEKRLEEE